MRDYEHLRCAGFLLFLTEIIATLLKVIPTLELVGLKHQHRICQYNCTLYCYGNEGVCHPAQREGLFCVFIDP